MKSKIYKTESGISHLWIWCPGCDEPHCPVVASTDPNYSGPVWEWNGDMEKPTVSPSLLCQFERGENYKQTVCHTFVRDGQIQFLGDCTHELAGQTVPLPHFPCEENDEDGDY